MRRALARGAPAILDVLAVVLLLAAAPRADAQTPGLDPAGVAPVLAAEGRRYTLESRILGETRTVLVSLPRSFDATGPDREFPVVLVFDGEFNFAPTAAAVAYLADAGHMPEALVVGIENGDRLRDLTPPGLSVSGSGPRMAGDRFLDFVSRELMPALSRRFRAGGSTVLVGHSSGAILATWAAATRSDRFPLVVALDAPVHLQEGWLADRMMEAADADPAPALRYVSLESRFGWPDPAWHALAAAAPPTWTVSRRQLDGESHQSMVFMGTYLGLRAIYDDYSALAAPASPTRAILAHYGSLDPAYGAVVPPRSLLDRVVEDFLIEGRPELAGEALDRLEAGYGATDRTRALRQRVTEAADQAPLEVTVADLLAEPRPAVDGLTWLLGEWRGAMGSEGSGSQSPIVVRFVERDGRVEGEMVQRPGTAAEDVQSLDYIRIAPDGVHFGVMNRMRPRGMLVYEAVRNGSRLEGRMELRGVRFTPPGGRSLPVTRFTLQKGGS